MEAILSSIPFNIFLLILGMFLLIKGADFFVDGASSIAKKLKIPALVIGLTLVSMGTSAPEASVSISSSFAGASDASLSNIIGSNMFNLLVVLGASLLFTRISVSKSTLKVDFPFLIGITVLLALFCYLISPNVIETWEGIILLILFIGYLVFIVLRAKKSGEEVEEDTKNMSWLKSIVLSILGLAGIIFGGRWVVDGAGVVATSLNMEPTLVGLTIYAIGTSLPELVTSVVAAKKGENEIAVGNVVGSGIFNILFVLGLSSTILPLAITENVIIDFVFNILVTVLFIIFCLKKKELGKKHGFVLLGLYVVYFVYILLRNYNIIGF